MSACAGRRRAAGASGAIGSFSNKSEAACVDVRVCREEESEECGICHNVYYKECQIRMETVHMPAKKKVCRAGKARKDCRDGYRRECVRQYSTECDTRWEYKEVEEKRPVCAINMVERCDEESGCSEVPALKCKLEKTKVKKKLPETVCHRQPRSFCKKRKCKPEKVCYYKITMITEQIPREKCEYYPKRVCQKSTYQGPGGGCRTVKKQVCSPRRECREQNEVDHLNNVSVK